MVFHTLYIFVCTCLGVKKKQRSISRTRRRNLERFTLNRARFLFGCLSHFWSSRFQTGKCGNPWHLPVFTSVYPSRTNRIWDFSWFFPLPLVGKTGAINSGLSLEPASACLMSSWFGTPAQRWATCRPHWAAETGQVFSRCPAFISCQACHKCSWKLLWSKCP